MPLAGALRSLAFLERIEEYKKKSFSKKLPLLTFEPISIAGLDLIERVVFYFLIYYYKSKEVLNQKNAKSKFPRS